METRIEMLAVNKRRMSSSSRCCCCCCWNRGRAEAQNETAAAAALAFFSPDESTDRDDDPRSLRVVRRRLSCKTGEGEKSTLLRSPAVCREGTMAVGVHGAARQAARSLARPTPLDSAGLRVAPSPLGPLGPGVPESCSESPGVLETHGTHAAQCSSVQLSAAQCSSVQLSEALNAAQ